MAGLLTSHPSTCTSYKVCGSAASLSLLVHIGPHTYNTICHMYIAVRLHVCVYCICVCIGYEFRLIPSFYPVCLHYQQVQKTGSCSVITTLFRNFRFSDNDVNWKCACLRIFQISIGKCLPILPRFICIFLLSDALSVSPSLWGANNAKRVQSYKWKRDWNCLRIRFSLLLAHSWAKEYIYFPFFSVSQVIHNNAMNDSDSQTYRARKQQQQQQQ